jgi:VanZ family protein
MVIIFAASTDIGAAPQSQSVISRLLAWLGLVHWLTPPQLDAVNYGVRKAGHLTEYALLAVLLHRARARSRVRWTVRRVVEVLIVVVLYAMSDELHQGFVASRTASVGDVLLDSVGAAAGLSVKWLVERRWKRQPYG